MTYLAQIKLLNSKSQSSLPNANDNTLRILMNDAFIIIGALAVLMMVIAGFRYILARGSPEKITQAKNMIMYSLIGLGIVVLASTIVNLVLERAG